MLCLVQRKFTEIVSWRVKWPCSFYKVSLLAHRPDRISSLQKVLSSGDNVQDAGIVSISLSVHTGVITPAGYSKRTNFRPLPIRLANFDLWTPF